MPRLALLLIGYFIFLLFGALLFFELNTIEEKKRHIHIHNQIRLFLSRNRKCLKEQDLYSYVDYYLDKSHTNLWHSSLPNRNITKWTIGQGLFFATSLLTTVGYGSPNLITSYGKIICIVYTAIGLIFAVLFQRIVHRRSVPVLYRIIFRLGIHRHVIVLFTKHHSYSVAFLFVTGSLVVALLIIPTWTIHQLYVPHWSLIDSTYFAVTTNHLIGFGDLMPCGDLHGQDRSTCAMVMTVYVIVQVLAASVLTHMCLMFPEKSRQFLNQRRHDSGPSLNLTGAEKFSIDISNKSLSTVFT